MRHINPAAFLLALLPASVLAEVFQCETIDIAVQTDQPSYAAMICDAAQRASQQFERCNMPAIPAPLEVQVVPTLNDGCVGLYHCGEGLIEVLAPPAMLAKRMPESAFAMLGRDAYFQSVIIHELAHAAIDDLPCPFDACLVADEYLAYTMQVMSLPLDLRDAFTQNAGPETQIPRDELSATLLFMAPQRFAQKAWLHLAQRDDPCGFVGQIVDRTVLLDRERFDSGQ